MVFIISDSSSVDFQQEVNPIVVIIDMIEMEL